LGIEVGGGAGGVASGVGIFFVFAVCGRGDGFWRDAASKQDTDGNGNDVEDGDSDAIEHTDGNGDDVEDGDSDSDAIEHTDGNGDAGRDQ
jgi:hypothetical protein